MIISNLYYLSQFPIVFWDISFIEWENVSSYLVNKSLELGWVDVWNVFVGQGEWRIRRKWLISELGVSGRVCQKLTQYWQL